MLAQPRRFPVPDNADTTCVLRADLNAQVSRLKRENNESEKSLEEKSKALHKALQRNTTASLDLRNSQRQNGILRATIDRLERKLLEKERMIEQQTREITSLKKANSTLSQQLLRIPDGTSGLRHTGTSLCCCSEVGHTNAEQSYRLQPFSTMRIILPPYGLSLNRVLTLQYGSSRQVHGYVCHTDAML